MRLGILIIGSLYWDPSRVRCRWRQNRLSCTSEHKVRVPIRYGKRAAKNRGNTYTMVFAKSCSEDAKLGIGIVVPARAECCEPEHLLEEAEHLWAAERNCEEIQAGIHFLVSLLTSLSATGLPENFSRYFRVFWTCQTSKF